MATLEGWPDIMDLYLRYSDIYGLFFIVFILIVTYFFMNLFVGVMFSSFNDAITQEKKKGIQNNHEAEKYGMQFSKQEKNMVSSPLVWPRATPCVWKQA